MKVITPNPEKLEKLKTRIKKEGYQHLHILSDFDRTLTYGKTKGARTPSLTSMLRDGNHLIAGYAEKAQALYNKYSPYETLQPSSERKKIMQEWWSAHNNFFMDLNELKKEILAKYGHKSNENNIVKR